MVGLAGPFLRAAAEGPDAARDLARELLEVLRITMFCVGAPTVAALKGTPRLVGPHRAQLEMRTSTLTYVTPGRHEFIDITADVAEAVRRSGVGTGVAHVCSFHTTAAIRVNENEPLLLADFRRMLDRLVPLGEYDHDDLSRRTSVPVDEPLNGHSHCQHLLLSSSESLPVCDGKLLLGRWQSIFLVELDSSRSRQVTVQVLGT
jgi:secondary thiamine-phosphate synthase enzyme